MDTLLPDLARVAPPREPGRDLPRHARRDRVLVVDASPEASYRIRRALHAAGFDVAFLRSRSVGPGHAALPAAALSGAASGDAAVLRVGRLELDAAARRARLGGREVGLTPTELDVLLHLARRRGAAVSHAELLRAVRDRAGDETSRTVVMHVSAIRRKLGDDPARPRFVQTVRGFGYRMP